MTHTFNTRFFSCSSFFFAFLNKKKKENKKSSSVHTFPTTSKGMMFITLGTNLKESERDGGDGEMMRGAGIGNG